MKKKPASPSQTKTKFVRIPHEIAKRVEALAQAEGRTDSQQIVQMLRKQIAS